MRTAPPAPEKVANPKVPKPAAMAGAARPFAGGSVLKLVSRVLAQRMTVRTLRCLTSRQTDRDTSENESRPRRRPLERVSLLGRPFPILFRRVVPPDLALGLLGLSLSVRSAIALLQLEIQELRDRVLDVGQDGVRDREDVESTGNERTREGGVVERRWLGRRVRVAVLARSGVG